MDDKSTIKIKRTVAGIQPVVAETVVVTGKAAVTFESRCEETVATILSKPTSIGDLLDVMGIKIMQERYDLSRKKTDLIDALYDAGSRAEVYKDFSDVTYKYDKTLMQFQDNRIRYEQMKAVARSRRKRAKASSSGGKSAREATRRRPR